MRPVILLLAAMLVVSCAKDGGRPGAAAPNPAGWRAIATEHDRDRIREWRDAWTRALARARAAGHGATLAQEGVLLQPDAALAYQPPPPGDYRCRTIKIGAKTEGLLDYIAYPYFACRITAGNGAASFAKLTGSQRQTGRIYPDSPRREVLLGTLALGDERGVLPYGRDRERDVAGIVERVGERRWRIVFPLPAFESLVDVLELVPA